jgi:hypothetical protein
MVFLHAHLQVVYYNCVKFHKNSICSLVGDTVVVHNLQMCMKEYRCCLKFKRGDNSTYTFTQWGVVYLVSATPPTRLIGFL